MRFSRKLLGVAAVGAAVTLLATGCASDGGSSDSAAAQSEYDDVIEVNFGYIPDFNGTSLLAIAEDQGYWAKYGLDVETPSFTNGPLQIQALGTGDLDFGYIGPGAFWLPASGEAKIIAMNTLGQSDRVVGQPGNDSMEDLRGKTVAVPEGTSGDMILTLALEDAGMTKDDVELVPMEPSAIVSALASGQVQGAGFWYPALATVKEQVPDLVEIAQNSDFEETVAFPTAFVAGNDVVENEPEKVDRVLKALRDAITFRYENPDEAVDLTAAYNALDAEAVAADAANNKVLSLEELDTLTEDGTVDSWLNGMQDYFVAAGKLTEVAEPSSFYTGDVFLQAGE
ncbi:aliphatic sulfonate ABC transporter substrate-binding protein [Agromyces binzhouensis]|uniref:Aliphatic sulfonate ABC transporter substrate-binding protein n=1 Tax=Agromyces binzhouensis TaxID=1817495 RepID=A0A4Q2JQ26_9MICO|nr:aliphatic sulfonate ABC transporter substrate-binding protein [Agromyces binzhouensis]RXZ50132.1 aliphatic sulfonate ABC transporter substrate-binding protein [Agromyces binzhouensis]